MDLQELELKMDWFQPELLGRKLEFCDSRFKLSEVRKYHILELI